MKLRKWTAEEKMAIVLEGLKGQSSIPEICRDHQISQTLFYRWRDRFLEAGQKGLAKGTGADGSKALQAEIEKPQKIIGRQTIAIEALKNPGINLREAVELTREKGVSLNASCATLGTSRSGHYRKTGSGKKMSFLNETLVERIKGLRLALTFWGYRRMRAWLRYREGYRVNRKRIQKLMKENSLTVEQKRHKALRTSPRAKRPNQYWGMDITKFLLSSPGWCYLIIVLDWFTKEIVGWNVSLRAKTADWTEALDRALCEKFPLGARDRGVSPISDNGLQPTSASFMRDTALLGIDQIFCS